MHLVVGATGLLGHEICRLLRGRGKAVRALVRASSDPSRVAGLEALGAEVVRGDLKRPDSLAAACRDVRAVVSTASATVSRREGDAIDTVDRDGQLNLVEAAEAAGVQQFVLVSFPPIDLEFPLQSAKRAVERRLQAGTMAYTILQPTVFMEVWLSPALGFDPGQGSATVFGAGDQRVSWISYRDVAVFAVDALDHPAARNAVVPLGGPDALTPLEAVRLAEEVTGRTFTVQHVPAEALEAQYRNATDPLQRSFAALSLSMTRDGRIDMSQAEHVFGRRPLRSVREHLVAAPAGPTA